MIEDAVDRVRNLMNRTAVLSVRFIRKERTGLGGGR